METWLQTAERRLAAAKMHDLSYRENRRDVARWRREVWRARYGRPVAALGGGIVGWAITQWIIIPALGWWS